MEARCSSCDAWDVAYANLMLEADRLRVELERAKAEIVELRAAGETP